MANAEHIRILGQGVEFWNQWMRLGPFRHPDLSEHYFSVRDLSGINLDGGNLFHSVLTNADLSRSLLGRVDFRGAYLENADLSKSDLTGANFRGAHLEGANLTKCILSGVDFSHAILSNADLTDAYIQWGTFGYNDLSVVKGLEAIHHLGPSIIGIDTLYLSRGEIPEIFLRGAGLSDNFITQVHALVGAEQAIHYNSCFISYSHKDEAFAKHLYTRMRQADLRVWFAPEDMKGGEKLHEQIESAIHFHDRLLVILSESSLNSEWVMTEIRNARKVESMENRRKLFPIRLVDIEALRGWKCFDADNGKDLAVEVREYFIPDFSNWEDFDSFEAAFKRLLRDLITNEHA